MLGFNEEQLKVIKKGWMIECIIAGAFLWAVAIYGFVLHLAIAKGTAAGEAQDFTVMRVIFIVMSVSCLVAARILPGILEKNAKKVSRSQLSEEALAPIRQVKMISLVVILGLCEAVVLLGLILAFQTRNLYDFYAFAVFGVIGIIMNFPRLSQWEKWIV